ncbi:BLUF domain-containing protein [Bradyrhizobium sp. 27S5]|uniref:BLUF domain-containing protein n=1 Tax=Bradyrhizobium sp. 27S5 TaxID=3139728 RepID=UPI0039C8A90B
MSRSEHALIYVSRSNSNVRDSSASEIIRSILARSRSKNAKLGVTGALLFSEGYFCQVLEGDQAAVEEIFNVIECDVRHRDITLLTFRPSTPRRFRCRCESAHMTLPHCAPLEPFPFRWNRNGALDSLF